MGKLHIVSRSGESFLNRVEAGLLLAQELDFLQGQKVVVLGITFVDPEIVRLLGISVNLIEEEKAYQLSELNRRAEKIRRILPKVPVKGRPVIITDDGVATGATTLTAIRAARFEDPSRLILALPVGPEDAVRQLAEEADETVCLRLPPDFRGVGQFYRDFGQVSDEEMLDILKEARRRKEEV